MEKKFSKFDIAAIKRTAANVSKYVTEKTKLEKKQQELAAKVEELQQMIDGWQEPIKAMTGGYTTESLVTRVVDKSGKNPITKFELIYPETVVPADDVADTTVETESAPTSFMG